MNKHEKDIISKIESMSFEQIRDELASGSFGDIGSPNYNLCLSWLSLKEASLRDSNTAQAARWARHAAYAAYTAAIIATISIITTIIIAVFNN